jgi:hypothetical protein
MSTPGYLKQVICEITLHFGSSTNRVLKSGRTMTERVEQATRKEELSSTQSFLHELTHSLAFHARACGLEFGHHVFHHRAHIFHGG